MKDGASGPGNKAVTRRSFLKMATSMGLLAGLTGALAGCDDKNPKHPGGEGWLPYQYNTTGTTLAQVRGRVPIDLDNPSIMRDDQKCILCGQCLETCQNIESVYGYYSLPIVDETICINCGQCSMSCPTEAISERDDTDKVFKALDDQNKFVLVQTAPATRVALGEEFGLPPGTWVQGQQVAALRRLGFDAVLDTNFTADLTIMEEGTELIKRIKGEVKKPLPQFTSCSPGWIKFCEYFYPDLLPNMSSCKSPQQMFGALAKTYYAKARGIDPASIVSVSIMPCTAKKFECNRPEMTDSGFKDVDYVITTRELAKMIKQAGIDFASLENGSYDDPLGEYTGAGTIFGATGGVMEAALRTAYEVATGKTLDNVEFMAVRGLQGIKEATIPIEGIGDVKVAVAHGLGNARKLLESIKAGTQYHFIEIMACPGGCVSGGGQPIPVDNEIRRLRAEALYQEDRSLGLRKSHQNPSITKIYEEFLGTPLGEKSHHLLHTKYTARGVYKED